MPQRFTFSFHLFEEFCLERQCVCAAKFKKVVGANKLTQQVDGIGKVVDSVDC